jgi:hypothetical protein
VGAVATKLAAPVTVALAVGGAAVSFAKHRDVKRGAAAGVDAALFGLTDFEGKVATMRARAKVKKLTSTGPVGAGGSRQEALRRAYDAAAKNSVPVKSGNRKKAQRHSSLSSTLVKGHYATGKSGSAYFVKGHTRRIG